MNDEKDDETTQSDAGDDTSQECDDGDHELCSMDLCECGCHAPDDDPDEDIHA